MSSTWTMTTDRDGIAWLTFDLDGEKVNKFTAAALEELKGLPENANLAADTWRQRAQQRVAADAAITRLNGLLAGQLATGG